MAWNPHPQVAAARDFGKKFGLDQVIILGLKEGDYLIASYGKTRALCDLAEQIAERLENLLDEITE